MDKETILYEIGYLLKSSLKDDEVVKFAEKLRNIISEKKGLIISEGKPKKQTLEYPIKKESSAFFNWIKFMLGQDFIKEIKETLDKEKNLLRFLIIKTKKEGPAKPTILKPKKRIIKKTKEVAEETPKIKEEEIDKKIEELLGN